MECSASYSTKSSWLCACNVARKSVRHSYTAVSKSSSRARAGSDKSTFIAFKVAQVRFSDLKSERCKAFQVVLLDHARCRFPRKRRIEPGNKIQVLRAPTRSGRFEEAIESAQGHRPGVLPVELPTLCRSHALQTV